MACLHGNLLYPPPQNIKFEIDTDNNDDENNYYYFVNYYAFYKNQ